MSWMEQIPGELINVRPLVFLCGPYLENNDEKDRRHILRKYLGTYEKLILYKNKNYIIKPLALIVDNLFEKEEIQLNNVTLIEEIIAACAYKNYIFVDTMSTALELGLFSNSYSQNKTTAFLPDDYKLFKPSIGYFVTETMEKSNNIQLISYKNKRINKITKKDDVLSVAENIISFKGNDIPKEIKNVIREDFNKEYDSFLIKIEFTSDPLEYNKIYYQVTMTSIFLKIPSQILFYLVNEHKTKEKILGKLFFYFQKYAANKNKELLTYCYLIRIKSIRLQIDSEFKYNINDVITSMNFLITTIKNRIGTQKFTTLKYDKVGLGYYQNRMNIYDIFGFSEEVFSIKRINKTKMKAVCSQILLINGKRRKIFMYAPNSYGFQLRLLHIRINKIIDNIIPLNEYSYAYKKNYSVLQCLNKHKENKYFLKIDINNFFNSISKRVINKIIKCHLCDNSTDSYEKNIINKLSLYQSSIIKDWEGIEEILNLCFIKGHLSLGLTSSPQLSNVYMDFFDKRFKTRFQNLVFTRYSDDILISSGEIFDTEAVLTFIKKEFSYLKLSINDKKTHTNNLKAFGDHVGFLGLNIVKGLKENRITVGKKYIYEVSKNISNFENNCTKLTFSQILGQVQYIKYVSSDDYEKLKAIYKIKTSKDFDLDSFKYTSYFKR